MKPRTRAVYLSTMWPPLSQGGEELSNQENFTILQNILGIQVLATTPESSPDFTHAYTTGNHASCIHRSLSPEGATNGDNIKQFHQLVATHRPEILLAGHPHGFGTGLVQDCHWLYRILRYWTRLFHGIIPLPSTVATRMTSLTQFTCSQILVSGKNINNDLWISHNATTPIDVAGEQFNIV